MNISSVSHINELSEKDFGVYYISKKNVIKEFAWAKNAAGRFADCKSARAAMLEFISSRKDKDVLGVTLVERNRDYA